MPQGDYGDLTIGRLLLRETFKVVEASSESRSIDIEGQESSPPRTRAEVVWRHDNLLALEHAGVHPLTFTDKPERNCYVRIGTTTADYTEWRGDVVTSDWKLNLTRLGSETEVDLQSRMTGAARLNGYSATGERWHAPPIGHYGYYSAGGNPTVLTRTGADGAITVYRGVPAGAQPQWGCAPSNYLSGRARLTSGGVELCGTNQSLAASGWALTNGLVNVTTGASGTLDVQAYTGGAWRSKLWSLSDGSPLSSWLGATLLRNDPEMVILRLTGGTQPGRVVLDLTLRRGSRVVEAYLQRSTSATLSVFLASSESTTNNLGASGYVVASGNDGAGNRYTAGSAAASTSAHGNGGITKSSTTALDFYLGVVAGGGSAVSGDTAVHLRDQYIGAVSELISAVRR